MTGALPAWLPDRKTVTNEITTAAVVGATLFVLDGSAWYALAAAATFFALRLLTDLAETVVGDYAGNACFGLLVLAATGYATVLTTPWWIVAAGAALGGWFLVDGVQHLRHGVSRREVSVPYSHDGSVVTGLPKALLVRLVAPILLESRERESRS